MAYGRDATQGWSTINDSHARQHGMLDSLTAAFEQERRKLESDFVEQPTVVPTPGYDNEYVSMLEQDRAALESRITELGQIIKHSTSVDHRHRGYEDSYRREISLLQASHREQAVLIGKLQAKLKSYRRRLEASQAATHTSIDLSQHQAVLKSRLHQLQQQLFEEARRLLVDNDQQVQQRYEEVLQQQRTGSEAQHRAQAQRIAQLETELDVRSAQQQQRSYTQQQTMRQAVDQCQQDVHRLKAQQQGALRSHEELNTKAKLIMHAGMSQLGEVAEAKVQQVQQQCQMLERQVQQDNAIIAQLRADLQRSSERNATLSKAVEESETRNRQITNAEANVHRLSTQLAQATAAHDTAQAERRVAKEAEQLLLTRVVAAEAELESHRNANTSLQSRIAELTAALSQAQNQAQQATTSSQEVGALRRKLAEIVAQATGLQEANIRARQQLEQGKTERQRLLATVSELETALGHSKYEHAQLREAHVTLQKRAAGVLQQQQQDREQTQQSTQDLVTERDALQTALLEAEDRTSQQTEAIRRLQAETVETKRRLDETDAELRTTHARHAQETASLREQLNSSQHASDQYKQRVAALEAGVATLRNTIQEQQGAMADAEQRSLQVEKTHTTTADELARVRREHQQSLSRAETEYSNLQTAHTGLQQTQAQLRAGVQQAQTSLAQVRATQTAMRQELLPCVKEFQQSTLAAITPLVQQFQHALRQNEELSAAVTELQAQVDSQRAEAASIQQQNDRQLARAQSEVTALKSAKHSLEQAMSTAQSERALTREQQQTVDQARLEAVAHAVDIEQAARDREQILRQEHEASIKAMEQELEQLRQKQQRDATDLSVMADEVATSEAAAKALRQAISAVAKGNGMMINREEVNEEVYSSLTLLVDMQTRLHQLQSNLDQLASQHHNRSEQQRLKQEQAEALITAWERAWTTSLTQLHIEVPRQVPTQQPKTCLNLLVEAAQTARQELAQSRTRLQHVLQQHQQWQQHVVQCHQQLRQIRQAWQELRQATINDLSQGQTSCNTLVGSLHATFQQQQAIALAIERDEVQRLKLQLAASFQSQQDLETSQARANARFATSISVAEGLERSLQESTSLHAQQQSVWEAQARQAQLALHDTQDRLRQILQACEQADGPLRLSTLSTSNTRENLLSQDLLASSITQVDTLLGRLQQASAVLAVEPARVVASPPAVLSSLGNEALSQALEQTRSA
eukprot:m.151882 g.151882  ORF g.151882 m.151882 type:complete len:1215 (-) comp16348_c0_seq1:819-4463(-)